MSAKRALFCFLRITSRGLYTFFGYDPPMVASHPVQLLHLLHPLHCPPAVFITPNSSTLRMIQIRKFFFWRRQPLDILRITTFLTDSTNFSLALLLRRVFCARARTSVVHNIQRTYIIFIDLHSGASMCANTLQTGPADIFRIPFCNPKLKRLF